MVGSAIQNDKFVKQKRRESEVKMRQKLRKIQRGLLVESVLGLGWRGDQEIPPEGYLRFEQPFKEWRQCLGQELTSDFTRKAQASLMLRKVGSYLL